MSKGLFPQIVQYIWDGSWKLSQTQTKQVNPGLFEMIRSVLQSAVWILTKPTESSAMLQFHLSEEQFPDY